MKILKLLTLLTTVALLGCDKESATERTKDSVLKFRSGISTRMSGTQWDANDKIGIYMLRRASDATGPEILAENIQYATIGDGLFEPLSDPITYPDDGLEVDFVAYYPYNSSCSDLKYPVDVSDQEVPAKIDFLLSVNAEGKSAGDGEEVELQFDHMLAKLTFEITDLGGNSLENITVRVGDLFTKSLYDMASGDFTDDPASASVITARNDNVSGSAAGCSALVLPAAASAGRKITIEVPSTGNSYVWDIPDDQVYLSGKRYKYEFNLDDGGELVVVNPGSDINDWEDENGGGGTLVPANGGNGTEHNPYTIGQLADKAGESDVWVKGYAVGVVSLTRSSSAIFEPPFTASENILMASQDVESDISNCAIIDLTDNEEIRNSLNLAENSSLHKQEISVCGTIEVVEGQLRIVNIVSTNRPGDPSPDPGPGPGTGEELQFLETFGYLEPGSDISLTIDQYTNWDMKHPIRYSGDAIVRYNGDEDDDYGAKLLFSQMSYADDFIIEGLEGGYTNMFIEYEIMGLALGLAAQNLYIYANDVHVNADQNEPLAEAQVFYKLRVELPDNTTTIKFHRERSNYYIDNIRIGGVK